MIFMGRITATSTCIVSEISQSLWASQIRHDATLRCLSFVMAFSLNSSYLNAQGKFKVIGQCWLFFFFSLFDASFFCSMLQIACVECLRGYINNHKMEIVHGIYLDPSFCMGKCSVSEGEDKDVCHETVICQRK